MRRILSLIAALAVLSTACGDDAPAADPVTSASYLAFRSQPTACSAEQPPSALALQWEAPGTVDGASAVTIRTSCGPIDVSLDNESAPGTVNSFLFLAEQGFYDGTVIHRAYPGFMVQMGDPTASGTGNPGYGLTDELPGDGFAYERGVVAMANSGRPNSAGSQFFLMIGPSALPPTYSVFGTVTTGLDVLDRIAALPMGQSSDPVPTRPLETVYIEGVDISR